MQDTTMLLRHQNFMWAVRKEMGWPLFKPANDCLTFSTGRPMDMEIGMETARIATALRKDIVYSGWSSATAAEPQGFAVIIRELFQVDIVDRVFPWVADETAPLILISTRGDECFAIGRRGLLERVTGKPKHLAKGRKLAMKRIKASAATMCDALAENNVWVPLGGELIEPAQPVDTIVRFN